MSISCTPGQVTRLIAVSIKTLRQGGVPCTGGLGPSLSSLEQLECWGRCRHRPVTAAPVAAVQVMVTTATERLGDIAVPTWCRPPSTPRRSWQLSPLHLGSITRRPYLAPITRPRTATAITDRLVMVGAGAGSQRPNAQNLRPRAGRAAGGYLRCGRPRAVWLRGSAADSLVAADSLQRIANQAQGTRSAQEARRTCARQSCLTGWALLDRSSTGPRAQAASGFDDLVADGVAHETSRRGQIELTHDRGAMRLNRL